MFLCFFLLILLITCTITFIVDEFYLQMNNSKVTKGVHRSTVENEQLDKEVLKLMKTQDLGYITHRKSIDDGKIRKLRENLHLIGKKRPKSHKVFCEDEEVFDEVLYDRKVKSEGGSDIEEDDEEEAEDYDVNDKKDIHTNIGKFTKKEVLKLKMKKAKSYTELERRIVRSKKLETASKGLTLQRNLTNSKGTKRKIKLDPDDSSKVVYKWKRQRAK